MTSPTSQLIRYQRVGHVGSFLRPQQLLDARKQVENGTLSPAELRKIEDDIIAQLVDAQIKAGLQVVTDGEQRREYFHLDFLKHLDGITIVKNTLTQDSGFVPPSISVTGKIRHAKPIQLDDFLFLKSQAQGVTPKVSIPSPTMAHFRAGRAGISKEAYPDLANFFDDLATAYRDEIKSLYDAGCRYIQLDDTNLAYLCDPDMRAAAQERGEDLETLPTRYASLINACIQDRPQDLVIGLHLCKGNFRSQFFAKGGYEPIAKTLFSEIAVDVLYLEWEDARSGDFSPLRYLSEDRVVVLGLLSSKLPELEDKGEIVRKIHEAATFAPKGLEQLALSTQCGFSSTIHGNNISHDDQWAKLRLAKEIAAEVWGTA